MAQRESHIGKGKIDKYMEKITRETKGRIEIKLEPRYSEKKISQT